MAGTVCKTNATIDISDADTPGGVDFEFRQLRKSGKQQRYDYNSRRI